MFVIRKAFLNMHRHNKKSALAFFITLIIVLFLCLYVGSIERIETQLKNLKNELPVTATVCDLSGKKTMGLKIPVEFVHKAVKSDEIENPRYTARMYSMDAAEHKELEYGSPEDPPLTIECINTLLILPKDVREGIVYAAGYDESFLSGDEAVCLMSEEDMAEKGLKLGDKYEFALYRMTIVSDYIVSGVRYLKGASLKIIGTYSMKSSKSDEVAVPNLVVSPGWSNKCFRSSNINFFYESLTMTVKDPTNLNKFKADMEEVGFTDVDVAVVERKTGESLLVDDEAFIQSATQMKKNLSLMRTFAPLIFVIVVSIGFVSSYLIMQSRRKEFAIMRSLGTGKGKSFVVIMLESVIIQILGGAAGIGIAYLFGPVSLSLFAAFFSFYLFGTALAIIFLNRFSVMEILTKTE